MQKTYMGRHKELMLNRLYRAKTSDTELMDYQGRHLTAFA